jgi:hypothetical protein
MNRPACALAALAAGCSPTASTSRTPAEPAHTSTAQQAPATPANAVTIVQQAGASLSPGLGSYAVSTDGTFPGGESISAYSFGTTAEYQDELARLAAYYPTSFGTYIMLPGKLAVIVVNGGGPDASGNPAWGGPTPQQIAARTGGTVKGG